MEGGGGVSARSSADAEPGGARPGRTRTSSEEAEEEREEDASDEAGEAGRQRGPAGPALRSEPAAAAATAEAGAFARGDKNPRLPRGGEGRVEGGGGLAGEPSALAEEEVRPPGGADLARRC